MTVPAMAVAEGMATRLGAPRYARRPDQTNAVVDRSTPVDPARRRSMPRATATLSADEPMSTTTKAIDQIALARLGR